MPPGAMVAIQLLSASMCGLQEQFSCELLQSTCNNGTDYRVEIYIWENSSICPSRCTRDERQGVFDDQSQLTTKVQSRSNPDKSTTLRENRNRGSGAALPRFWAWLLLPSPSVLHWRWRRGTTFSFLNTQQIVRQETSNSHHASTYQGVTA